MSDTPANVEEKLTVRLAPALLERVDRAARDRGLRRSEFVRQALAAHVEQTLGPGDAIS
ncbi:MAG: CopG family transcriptional regulator, partial [Chloroflexota bacterium]